MQLRFIPVYLLFCLFLYSNTIEAQIVINEASNKNYTQILDETGDNPDWLEIFNTTNAPVSLQGWSLSDNASLPNKWIFPPYFLQSGKTTLIFASGLNLISNINHWESVILPTDTFFYIVPNAGTPTSWKTLAYRPTAWQRGIAGFGYGDNDDSTIVPTGTSAVYIRKTFAITDTSVIDAVVLHVDYDDGFVAYLNGIEIARQNITGTPVWNTTTGNHEAVMYQGSNPEKFNVDMKIFRSAMLSGENVFAVEVHNAGTTSSDLSLIPFLSFAIKNNSTYYRPVPVWFDLDASSGFHANFKLSSSGETIYLSNPQHQIVDSLRIEQLQTNYSIGRTTDGAASFGIFITATPGKTNNTSTSYPVEYEDTPEFDQPAGFYSNPINLQITKEASDAVIRYTTDGSDPTATSKLYDGTLLNLTKTVIIKARCFSTKGKLPSKVKASSYFFNVNYTMPVVSITTNNEHLFGSTGICDNTYQEWNKPCYVEYFDKKQKLVFSQLAGIQIDGGAGGSRTHPQHSFRVEPGNSSLGDGDLNYKLIPDRPARSNYESFYLRNGSNQYLILPYKDGLETKAMGKGTNNYYAAYTPVVVYINGGYWGVYELREKLNADYFESNYGANPDSLDLLSLSYYYNSQLRALEGSKQPFLDDYARFILMNPNDASYLQEVDKFLDVKYYTDYIIGQSWIADTDWPHNNIKIVRGDFTGYRWRFALIDLEWALNPNGWTDYTFDHINFMRNQYQPYIRFWQEMIKNTAYKAQFINRFADLMNTNYQFSVIGPMEQEMFDLTYPEMGGEFLRWAGTGSTEAQYLATYTSNHNIFINSLKYRTAEVRKHIVSNFALPKQVNVNLKVSSVEGGKIQISTIIPAQYPWTGVYFDGVPITITAIPNPGYEFESWDKNALITAVNQSSLTTVLTINNLTFKANFKLSDKPYPIVTISEINYKDEPSIPTSDWIELYNYGTAPALLKGWSVADENPLQRFTITDSIVLQPQQRLVIAKDTALFKQTNPQVESVVGNFDFGLGSNTDQVQLLNEKDSLIASFRYYNTFPWSVGADGRGRTLELKDVTKSLNDPANWFDGCIGGSPGAEYSVCREPIVLSEINFSSPATAETDDWIELWNTSDKPVDIGNWILKDDNDASIFRVPAPRVIAPDERLIVAQDIDKFAAINRETKNITGGFAFGFSSSSDWVRMYDAEGKLKISVRYNTTAPWPIFDGSNYYTLELLNENGNMQSANNWFAGCPQGSPGKAYNSNCELVGIDNTNQYDIDIKVFPQPAIDYVDIAFYLNEAVDNTTFTIYNLVGKEIQQIKLGKVESGYHLKHLNISELSANIYILAVRLGNNEKRIKLVKM